jgi:5,5'-dehydrodivanillate O-demethylase
MENAVDPHHVEFLHGRYFEFIGRHEGFTAPPSFGKKHMKVGFDPFEWGIIKRRVVEGASEENDDWKIGHPLVFPYNMRVGGGGVHQMQIRVPVNRTTTRFMLYTVHRPEEGYEHVEQPMIPEYELPVFDARGRHVTNYVEGQDMMAWVTQGPVTDRTTEHLGRSDVGIALLRKMFREQMRAVAEGRDPLGVTREPHERIDLPCEKDKFNAGAEFALAFCDMGSTRHSPMLDTIRKIHISAAEKIGATVPAGT